MAEQPNGSQGSWVQILMRSSELSSCILQNRYLILFLIISYLSAIMPLKKRKSPIISAKQYCKDGNDQDGLERRIIDDWIGMSIFCYNNFVTCCSFHIVIYFILQDPLLLF